jgi:hypothetical protein
MIAYALAWAAVALAAFAAPLTVIAHEVVRTWCDIRTREDA